MGPSQARDVISISAARMLTWHFFWCSSGLSQLKAKLGGPYLNRVAIAQQLFRDGLGIHRHHSTAPHVFQHKAGSGQCYIHVFSLYTWRTQSDVTTAVAANSDWLKAQHSWCNACFRVEGRKTARTKHNCRIWICGFLRFDLHLIWDGWG
jgi:hypothetical protein